jgi:zinc-ribbon domain
MADQKYCRNCGAPNRPTAIFCTNCGNAFARAATLPQTAPSSAPSPLTKPQPKDLAKTSRKLDEIATKLKAIDPKDKNARYKVLRLMSKLNVLNANDMRMVNLYKIGLKYTDKPIEPPYRGLKKLFETYPNDAVGKEAERVWTPAREKYRVWTCPLPNNFHLPRMCACCGESERGVYKSSIYFEKFSLLTFLTSEYEVQLPVCDSCVTHAGGKITGPFALNLSYNDTANRTRSCRAVNFNVGSARVGSISGSISFRNKDFAYEFGRLNNFKFE